MSSSKQKINNNNKNKINIQGELATKFTNKKIPLHQIYLNFF